MTLLAPGSGAARSAPAGSTAAPGDGEGPPRPPTSAHLPPPPGTTSLVSTRLGGGFPNAGSAQPSISADGRYVAFASLASDLVTGDTNQAWDVFVLDRSDGSIIRLPVSSLGHPVPPGGSASDPSISADGNFVAFTYDPPPIGTTTSVAIINPPPFVVLWSRATGGTQPVGIPPNATRVTSREASVSGDGSRVAYTADWMSSADEANRTDVFVVERGASVADLVSVTPNGQPGNAASNQPAISRDGQVVAFQSQASDLVSGDSNGGADVFLRPVAGGPTEMISTGATDGRSEAPAISGDGRFVAFESTASTLVAGDAPGTRDVFLRDRTAGTTTLVSVTPAGGLPKGDSGHAAISDDGRIVAFASSAVDLVAMGDPPTAVTAALQVTGRADVFARDVVAAETIRISEAAAGGSGGRQSITPAVGGLGRFVAFASNSPSLVPGDTNQQFDAFLRDLPPVPSLTPPDIDFGTGPTGAPVPPVAATLRNDGWGPLSVSGSLIDGAADFAVVFDGCIGRVLRRTEACTVTVGFTPTVEGPQTGTLQVLDDASGSPRTASLRGGGSLARIELDPPMGRPGIVTIATGSGFPPGAEIGLSWDPGLTPSLPAVVADGTGSFRVQVLVFHNDVIGSRTLVAAPVAGPSFPSFSVPFEVLAGRGQPPRFLLERALGAVPAPIVLRR